MAIDKLSIAISQGSNNGGVDGGHLKPQPQHNENPIFDRQRNIGGNMIHLCYKSIIVRQRGLVQIDTVTCYIKMNKISWTQKNPLYLTVLISIHVTASP